VEGPWLKLYEHHPDYPSISGLTKHPVNSLGDGMEAPTRPTGSYHLKKGQLSTGGARAADAWRAEIALMRKDRLKKLQSANPKATEHEANNAMVADYKVSYPGITTWDDLSLAIGKHNFEGHHVKPVNWGGENEKHNICFLRKGEHAGFSGFFQRARNGLLNAAYSEKT
jgi:hypothetical protein